uniref:AbrB/MazE/SpoVT family DNA-binding domain-containing protein n=1 Tax=Conyzicola sp. TaxID=1969404 RepID=UPI0039893FD9
TIPIEVRRRLGIHTGSKVDFIEKSGGGYELFAATGSIRDISGMFTWTGPTVTLEQMDDAIAEAAAETMRS